ncbi:MAG: porin [Gemmatimonadaceae bacterium]|nr:porin [Chitinophagaceae bacterium]
MDMIDTTTELGKGMLSMYKKFDQVRISGYMQPQFQAASSEGATGYSGGDFSAKSNNRFMLRRGRIRFDYVHLDKEENPSAMFVFQFDGSERGVVIRDFWGRLFENKWSVFELTAGMFARPFGYEINVSSSDREAPERGRMSQILMRTERDLGAMVSFEPTRKTHPLRHLKIDAGFFNGQGLTSTTDFDSYKDFISRVSLKSYPVSKQVFISGGLSFFHGGFRQNTATIFRINSGQKTFAADSSGENIGRKVPRQYQGADVQVKWMNRGLATEFRAEYWQGRQTATASESTTPPVVLNEPTYIRNFNGGFFYFLQHIVNTKNQLLLKFDWYDPNTKIKSGEIGRPGANFSRADISYHTFGFGYMNYINSSVKLTLWYDLVRNEKTALTGYTEDLKDNVFTCRLQFRF